MQFDKIAKCFPNTFALTTLEETFNSSSRLKKYSKVSWEIFTACLESITFLGGGFK
jgi:hypothetical protein